MKIMLKHPAKRDNKPSKIVEYLAFFLELPQLFFCTIGTNLESVIFLRLLIVSSLDKNQV